MLKEEALDQAKVMRWGWLQEGGTAGCVLSNRKLFSMLSLVGSAQISGGRKETVLEKLAICREGKISIFHHS